MPEQALRYTQTEPAFGAWLIGQRSRAGRIGDFASGAHAGRAFSRGGDIKAMKSWMGSKVTSGDNFATLDDAENDWLCP